MLFRGADTPPLFVRAGLAPADAWMKTALPPTCLEPIQFLKQNAHAKWVQPHARNALPTVPVSPAETSATPDARMRLRSAPLRPPGMTAGRLMKRVVITGAAGK